MTHEKKKKKKPFNARSANSRPLSLPFVPRNTPRRPDGHEPQRQVFGRTMVDGEGKEALFWTVFPARTPPIPATTGQKPSARFAAISIPIWQRPTTATRRMCTGCMTAPTISFENLPDTEAIEQVDSKYHRASSPPAVNTAASATARTRKPIPPWSGTAWRAASDQSWRTSGL